MKIKGRPGIYNEGTEDITWYHPYRDPVVCRYGWGYTYKFFAYKGFEFILN